MTRTITIQTADAIRFLELLTSHCIGADAHTWRTCRRCLAFDLLRVHDPLADSIAKFAIVALREHQTITDALTAELDRLMSDNVELRRRLDQWEYDRKG